MREFCWLQHHLKKEERKADEKVIAFSLEAVKEVAAFLVIWRLRVQYDGVLCLACFVDTFCSPLSGEFWKALFSKPITVYGKCRSD